MKKAQLAAVSGLVGIIAISLVVIASGATFYWISHITFCSDCNGPDTMFLKSANLYAGTGSTNSSRGTAALTVAIENPGSSSYISSIVVYGTPSGDAFQCSNSSFCTYLGYPFSAAIPAKQTTYFDSNATAFYPMTPIVAGENYSLLISFNNGQSVSTTLTAHPGMVLPPGPAIDYSKFVTTNSATAYNSASSSSTTCTGTPHAITQTWNSSGTIFITVTTANC
jgi:hypothetical protein